MSFIIWYLIGFILCIIGEALFDKEITVRGIVQAFALGLIGPFVFLFFIIYSNRISEIIIWKRK